MTRNKRPPLGCRVRAIAYYQRRHYGRRDPEWRTDKVFWELEPQVIEGIYCGERYLNQKARYGEVWYPQIRTCLVALDHRRRVSVRPSDLEVL